jgi:hypothetical protein
MTKTNDPFDLGDEWCPECHKIVKIQEIYHGHYTQWMCDECGYVVDEDIDIECGYVVDEDIDYWDEEDLWGDW